MATTTAHKEQAMSAIYTPKSFDSSCGRWTVVTENIGDDWYLVNNTTGEREFLSADMEEALDIAADRIKA
jgi:hypothetical protein